MVPPDPCDQPHLAEKTQLGHKCLKNALTLEGTDNVHYKFIFKNSLKNWSTVEQNCNRANKPK